jgi:hypothetical protein
VKQAFRRMLPRWYLPVIGAVIAFPVSFLALVILPLTGPDEVNTRNPRSVMSFLVLWWDRLRLFGAARLLSSSWTVYHGFYPGDKQVFHGYFHVAFAASLTAAELVILFLFVRALVQSIRALAESPFPRSAP